MMKLRHAARMALAVLAGAASTLAAGAQPLGCLIEPNRVVEIGSPVVGVVESVKVERGDRVAKGSVVAVLRADVERAAVGIAASRANVVAEVQAAQANYELARQKLARATELVNRNFVSAQWECLHHFALQTAESGTVYVLGVVVALEASPPKLGPFIAALEKALGQL